MSRFNSEMKVYPIVCVMHKSMQTKIGHSTNDPCISPTVRNFCHPESRRGGKENHLKNVYNLYMISGERGRGIVNFLQWGYGSFLKHPNA